MIIHNNIVQGSPEWFALRSGKFTASMDFQQLATGKPDTYRKLIQKKASERITGQVVCGDYTNPNMERGKKLEQEAIDAFEMETGIAVRQIGFCELSEWVGASPDGLIDENAGAEIKSRDIHTHLECFLEGWDKSYKWQIQGNLWVTGREFWYFISYNPYYAHIEKHLFYEKIPRDENIIRQISDAVDRGIADVEKILKIFT